jgi:hypothetical protein
VNKTAAERSIEALTWASIVIWLGFALVAHILNYVWLVVMMLGIILLSSAIYQRSRGWHTSLSLWIFGIWMAVFSVIETVSALVAGITGGEGLGVDLWVYLGIALVSMGIAVVFRTVQGPALTSGPGVPSRRQAAAEEYTQSTRRYAAPRRVEEDNSQGYIPAPQERAQYDNYATSSRTMRSSRVSARTSRYASAPLPDDQQFTQRSTRAPRDDMQYSQPSEPLPRTSRAAPADRAGSRSTSPRQRRSRAASQEPNDLEARVDDIIRRSRDRRGGGGSTPAGGDDLPY